MNAYSLLELQQRLHPEFNAAAPVWVHIDDVQGRIDRLEEALRYWMPDETLVTQEHFFAWDKHIKLLQGFTRQNSEKQP